MHQITTHSWSVEVSVTPTVAFDYLCDVSRHAEWSPGPYRIDPVPPLPLHVGDSFQSFGAIPGNKQHPNQVEITVVDPPHRLVLSSEDRGKRYVHRFDVVPAEAGTRITRTVQAPRPSGLPRLTFPLLFRFIIDPEVRTGMRMLKANLDGATTAR